MHIRHADQKTALARAGQYQNWRLWFYSAWTHKLILRGQQHSSGRVGSACLVFDSPTRARVPQILERVHFDVRAHRSCWAPDGTGTATDGEACVISLTTPEREYEIACASVRSYELADGLAVPGAVESEHAPSRSRGLGVPTASSKADSEPTPRNVPPRKSIEEQLWELDGSSLQWWLLNPGLEHLCLVARAPSGFLREIHCLGTGYFDLPVEAREVRIRRPTADQLADISARLPPKRAQWMRADQVFVLGSQKHGGVIYAPIVWTRPVSALDWNDLRRMSGPLWPGGPAMADL